MVTWGRRPGNQGSSSVCPPFQGGRSLSQQIGLPRRLYLAGPPRGCTTAVPCICCRSCNLLSHLYSPSEFSKSWELLALWL